jgi:UDP-N-acetylmuramoylalanine--D-glutamate ligase
MDRETFFEYIKGKKITLCGIGRSHIPLVELFTEKGAEVSMRDRRTFEKLGEDGKKLEKQGVKLILGEDYLKDLTEDIIFRTPGMKSSIPELEQARKAGKVVTSELEVFFEICPCKIYAVTGSDGKSTTTTVISEFLRTQGKTVHLGGNIGKALLPEIESVQSTDFVVAELSSFQLISMRKSPDVAVITNLAPNHLDWHVDMQEYIDAKKNIFLHQNAFSRTVINVDNELTKVYADEARGDVFSFSRQSRVDRGAWYENGSIYVNGERILETADIRIPGVHNIENYLAAICAVYGEVDKETIVKVAKNFDGIEHRMEFVRELDGVKYYNDSIASSPSRTISGTLSLYKERVILISGGYDKQIPYDVLGPVVCDKAKLLILMGNTADKIEAAVRSSPNFREDELDIVRVQNMAEAVLAARGRGKQGDIVSLSPASAAFDLYKDFEERGRHFKELVHELK